PIAEVSGKPGRVPTSPSPSTGLGAGPLPWGRLRFFGRTAKGPNRRSGSRTAAASCEVLEGIFRGRREAVQARGRVENAWRSRHNARLTHATGPPSSHQVRGPLLQARPR